jgi:hypothetical protein
MAHNAIADTAAFFVMYGGYRFTGFSDSTSYSAVYDNPRMSKVSGVNGLGAFSKNSNKDATITLEVFQTSDDNDALSIINTVNLSLDGGFLLPFTAHDANGRTVQASPAAVVADFADVTISNGVETRTWTLIAADFISFVGGTNAPATGSYDRAKEIFASLPPIDIAN